MDDRIIRWTLLCSGAGSVAVAVLFDLEFVRTNLSPDGHVEPRNAAALQIVRLALGILGGCQIVAVLLLDRLAPAVRTFFASSRRTRWTIFVIPFLALSLIIVYKMPIGLNDRVYWILTQEDGIFEWVTALAFFGGFGLLLYNAAFTYQIRRFSMSIVLALLSFFYMFCGLEEISYGQRMLGFGTPEYLAEINRQQETNIHNIGYFSIIFFYLGPLSVGLFGMLGWILPLLRPLVGSGRSLLLSLLVPPWFLSSWFVPYALFTLYDRFLWGSLASVEWQDSEVIEALLGLGFLGFACHIGSGLRRL